MNADVVSIEKLIDHALLHPTMTDDQIKQGCEIARRLGVATVCVKPYAIPLAVGILKGSDVGVGTVIGFPHGSNPTEIKVAEARWAVEHGAVELDMVINIGKAIQGDWTFVENDIREVTRVAHEADAILKVIFETDYLQDDATKIKLCQICERCGVDFVKTSTGFGFVKREDGGYHYVGATEADIKLMRENSGEFVGVKASGGVRNFQQADRFRRLGATRLGTSASETIIAGSGEDRESY